MVLLWYDVDYYNVDNLMDLRFMLTVVSRFTSHSLVANNTKCDEFEDSLLRSRHLVMFYFMELLTLSGVI